jgi:hypothetical protein
MQKEHAPTTSQQPVGHRNSCKKNISDYANENIKIEVYFLSNFFLFFPPFLQHYFGIIIIVFLIFIIIFADDDDDDDVYDYYYCCCCSSRCYYFCSWVLPSNKFLSKKVVFKRYMCIFFSSTDD